MSLLVAAALTAVVALFLTGLFTPLPEATLGGIAVMAVSRMIKLRELRRLWRTRRADFVLAVVALLGVLVFEVLPGLGIAVVCSAFAVIYRAGQDLLDLAQHPGTRPVRGVLVARPNAPVLFADAIAVRDWVFERLDGVGTVVLDLEATTDLDVPGADMLRELHDDLSHRNVGLRLARVHHDVRELLDRAGVLDRLGADHLHATTREAVEHSRPPDH